MNETKSTPKDFFMYLATAVALYVSAGSLLSLLFAIINERFPDSLDAMYYGGYYAGGGATFAIASLIIVTPLYLVLSYLIKKDVSAHPGKREMAIRRWFVWFTLFAAGIVVAGDLVALLYTYLQGEITTRFILKAFAVFAVAGGIFGYYLYDLRRDASSAPNKALLGIASLVVLASIVLGFATFGSPTTQRDMRFDGEREMHLSDIQWQVLNHWQANEKLPADLSMLVDDFSGYNIPVDPQTGEAYEYTITGPLSFELCATFALESVGRGNERPMPVDSWGYMGSFQHEVGRTCFERTIDPVKYPPYTKR